MSKKSRKRNRNLLKMAALAGGAALLAGRGKGIGTGTTVSDAQKITSQLGAKRPIRGTVYPGSNKAWKIKNSLASPKWNRMDTSEVDWDYNAPSTERYNKPDFGMSSTFSGAMAKKGGRIVKTKGGGKAVRGLGRAFTKNKK